MRPHDAAGEPGDATQSDHPLTDHVYVLAGQGKRLHGSSLAGCGRDAAMHMTADTGTAPPSGCVCMHTGAEVVVTPRALLDDVDDDDVVPGMQGAEHAVQAVPTSQ